MRGCNTATACRRDGGALFASLGLMSDHQKRRATASLRGSLTNVHPQLQRTGSRAQHVGGAAAVKAGCFCGQIAQGEDDTAFTCPARNQKQKQM